MENTELLKKIFLFKDFTAMELLPFNKILASKQVEAGEVIINQDHIGDEIYIIKSGSVEVYLENNNRTMILATLSAIDHFGEIALLDDAPRSASVKATENSTIIVIKRKELEEILAHDHNAASKFYKAMSVSLANRLRKSNHAIRTAREQFDKIIPTN